MRLDRFAILVALLVVARAADQCIPQDPYFPPPANCNNTIKNIPCQNYVDTTGCHFLGPRIVCPKFCNTCSGYEHKRPRGDLALLYGGNHILTWDRLPFDCTGRGEFILYRNKRTGMKVHALFTRPKNVRNSVTTAIAAMSSTDAPRLQIAFDRAAASIGGQYDIGRCEEDLRFWVRNQRVRLEQVTMLGGYMGIAVLHRYAETIVYKMDLRSGARVRMTLRYSATQGCYFSQVQVLIISDQRPSSTGLLGTPDYNTYNDWPSATGGYVNLPTNRVGRYLKPAYDYATRNWCVRNSSGALIYYDPDYLGSFNEHMKCNAAYNGLYNFSSATEEMRAVCGRDNFECLHDSISTKSVSEGIQTIGMMVEIENDTVPDYKRGLSAQPRGIPAGKEWTVTILLRCPHSEPNLNGFGLFELHESSLRRTDEVVAFLTDDGVNAKGDAQQFDGIYSDQISLELANGVAKGYAAVPLINGNYEFGRSDLIYTLPNTVRGYSTESGRIEADDVDNTQTILLEGLKNRRIEVKFVGPEDREPIIGGARFLNQYVGDLECGDERFRKTDHLDCRECKKGPNGDITRLEFRVGRAFEDKNFTATASLFLEGFFLKSTLEDEPELVPVKIIVTERVNQIPGRSISMNVMAKERLVVHEDCRYCTRDFKDSLLGEVKVFKTEDGRWKITLSESGSIREPYECSEYGRDCKCMDELQS